MTLLPPKLAGPLTPLVTSVHVEYVLPGGVVEIFANGTSTGRTAIVSANSVDVPLSGYALPPNGVITAKWTLGGDQSPASLPELVLPFPNTLPKPVILSPVHTAVDWIAVGGLYPGSTVAIYGNAGLVGGPDQSNAATVNVHIHDPIASGEQLQVIQTITAPGGATVTSDPAESLPAEGQFSREELPPTPVVIGPITECAGAVLVGGAVPGCFMHLHTQGTEYEYAAVGETFWAIVPGAAHTPATFAASNHLERLNRSSGQSATVPVSPASPLANPTLLPDTQYCPRAVSVTAGSLVPGSALLFELRGASGTTALFRGGAPDAATTAPYWLGDLSSQIPLDPPFPAVVVTEQLCTQSAESNKAWIWRRPDPEAPPAFFLPPIECSHWLHVTNVWGAVVTVHSNATDWPVLAYWTVVPESGWVHLNRSLRYGEEVWVTVEQGCVPANLLVSDHVLVKAAGDLDAVKIQEPLRPGKSRTIYVENAIHGGRLHVFVNGTWRTSTWVTGEVTSPFTEVWVGELRIEDTVSVRMELCGKIGQPSRALVQLGYLYLKADPPSVTRGQATPLTIRAFDADYGFEMVGRGIQGPGGYAGYTGTAFTVTPATGTPSPLHFVVDIEGYDQGTLDVPIDAPAPPPPGILTIKTMSAVGLDPQNQIIKEIEWSLSGVGPTATQKQTPNANSTTFSIPLPVPAGGAQVTYTLKGKATIELRQATTTTKSVTAFSVYNGTQDSIVIEWKGNPRTAEINISFRPVYNPQTGAVIDTLFLFVLNSIT
ncbi:MAG: hypothetical protein QM589_13390 [Thermomicrobiales bacterium]